MTARLMDRALGVVIDCPACGGSGGDIARGVVCNGCEGRRVVFVATVHAAMPALPGDEHGFEAVADHELRSFEAAP